MCKVYIEYHGTSEIEHDLCACRSIIPSLKLGDYDQKGFPSFGHCSTFHLESCLCITVDKNKYTFLRALYQNFPPSKVSFKETQSQNFTVFGFSILRLLSWNTWHSCKLSITSKKLMITAGKYWCLETTNKSDCHNLLYRAPIQIVSTPSVSIGESIKVFRIFTVNVLDWGT